MTERGLFKVAGAALIVGALTPGIASAVHPKTIDFGDHPETFLRNAAEYPDFYAYDHIAMVLGVLIGTLGFYVLTQTFTSFPARVIARVGFATFLVGLSVLAVFVAVDGVATKEVATLWIESGGSVEDESFRAAHVVERIASALESIWLITFFGATYMWYGAAMVAGDEYPRRWGWFALVCGAACFLAGMAIPLGLNTVTILWFFTFSFLLMLWTIAVGIRLWRRGSPAPVLTDQRSSVQPL